MVLEVHLYTLIPVLKVNSLYFQVNDVYWYKKENKPRKLVTVNFLLLDN